MKKAILSFLCTISATMAMAQANPKSGYIITKRAFLRSDEGALLRYGIFLGLDGLLSCGYLGLEVGYLLLLVGYRSAEFLYGRYGEGEFLVGLACLVRFFLEAVDAGLQGFEVSLGLLGLGPLRRTRLNVGLYG